MKGELQRRKVYLRSIQVMNRHSLRDLSYQLFYSEIMCDTCTFTNNGLYTTHLVSVIIVQIDATNKHLQ